MEKISLISEIIFLLQINPGINSSANNESTQSMHLEMPQSILSTTLPPFIAEQELRTIPEHLHSPFFFWPLCCLSFDLRILITHLVSSNSSHSRMFITACKYLTILLTVALDMRMVVPIYPHCKQTQEHQSWNMMSKVFEHR